MNPTSKTSSRLANSILIWLALAAAGAGVGSYIYRQYHHKPDQTPEQLAMAERERAAEALEAVQESVAAKVAQGRSQMAIEEIKGVIAEHPNYAPARNVYAGVLKDSCQPLEAYDQYRKSLDLDNRQVEVHLLAGNLAWLLGWPDKPQWLDKAGEHFYEALRIEPDNVRCLIRRADWLLYRCRPDEAQAHLESALRTQDRDMYQQYAHEAMALLADVYAQKDDPKAMEIIAKALRELPIKEKADKEPMYLRKQAQILARFNYLEAALATLESLDPKHKSELFVVDEMARLYEKLNRPHLAAKAYENAYLYLEHEPVTIDYRLAENAARWYVRARDKTGARRALTFMKFLNANAPNIAELQTEVENLP